MSNRNTVLVQRFLDEVVNGGDMRLILELVAADHVRHGLDGDLYGQEGVRIDITEWRTGLSNLELVVEALLSGDDWVVSRFVLHGTHTGPFLGVPATQRSVALPGIEIDRIAGDRLVESWISLNALGLPR